MRQRARTQLEELDLEVGDWKALKDLTGDRMTAGKDALVAELADARDWWAAKLREQGYDGDLIERLLAEYEAAFTIGLRERIAGF